MRMANEMTNYKAVTITRKKLSRTQQEDESLNKLMMNHIAQSSAMLQSPDSLGFAGSKDDKLSI